MIYFQNVFLMKMLWGIRKLSSRTFYFPRRYFLVRTAFTRNSFFFAYSWEIFNWNWYHSWECCFQYSCYHCLLRGFLWFRAKPPRTWYFMKKKKIKRPTCHWDIDWRPLFRDIAVRLYIIHSYTINFFLCWVLPHQHIRNGIKKTGLFS